MAPLKCGAYAINMDPNSEHLRHPFHSELCLNSINYDNDEVKWEKHRRVQSVTHMPPAVQYRRSAGLIAMNNMPSSSYAVLYFATLVLAAALLTVYGVAYDVLDLLMSPRSAIPVDMVVMLLT